MKGRPESIGVRHDPELWDSAAEEEANWMNKGELPKRYIEGIDWLARQIKGKSLFYREHRGMSVAVISVEPRVMEVVSDHSVLIERAWGRWRKRPVATMYLN